MNKKVNADEELVTKGFLAEQFEKFGREVDEKARQYRDDILTKMDEVVGKLDDDRIEHIALKNDVENLDMRVTKLEQTSKAM